MRRTTRRNHRVMFAATASGATSESHRSVRKWTGGAVRKWAVVLAIGLLAAGALDVALAPIQMKKHRPAVALTVIAPLAAREGLLARLFADSTTLGVRGTEVERVTARRWFETIETLYGPLQVEGG